MGSRVLVHQLFGRLLLLIEEVSDDVNISTSTPIAVMGLIRVWWNDMWLEK